MNYEQLKNSILQEAIKGRLVPQDPNDEPAAVLLDRIADEKKRLIKEKKNKRDKNESRIFRTDDGHWMERFSDKNRHEVCIDDEIPFDIPESWEWCRIKNLFDHSSGKQQSSSNKGGGTLHKFITTSNLYWGYFVLDKVKVMNFTDYEVQTCSATKGDLLVCEGGAGYGRSAIWDKDYDICLQNHIHRLRPFNDGFICHYVYYLLYFLKETNKLISVGTAMPGLSANRLKSILVPLPPLSEQHRIVSKLEELLPKVEEYGKAQNRLDALNTGLPEKLKASILQEAIEGRLVEQNPDDEPASKLLDRIAEEKAKLVKEKKIKADKNASRIYRSDDGHWMEHFAVKHRTDVCIDDDIPFDIPDNWEWCRVGTIVEIGSARRVHQKDWRKKGIPFYRAREIGKLADFGSVENELFIDKSLYKEFSKSGVPLPGDLMVTAVGTLGKIYIVKDGETFYYKDGSVLCLRNLYNLNSNFLKLALTSPYFKKQYKQESQGTTVATLTMVRLQRYLIPIPPINEQKLIVEKLQNILPKLNALK